MLKCQQCNRIIVDSTQDGGVKVRSRMIVFHDGRAHALCPTCKTEVEVPLAVDTTKFPPSTKGRHIVQT
jgi:hypothetical protein